MTADDARAHSAGQAGSPDRAKGKGPGDGDGDVESDGDLGDLLQELRVLLQGVQVLTGFLIILPFNETFERVSAFEKQVYVVMFLCVLVSLVLFSATAAQHRLMRPLRDRVEFKATSTRLVVMGMIPFSAALVLAAHFVMTQVAGPAVAHVAAAVVGVAILLLWWIVPLVRRNAMRRRRGR